MRLTNIKHKTRLAVKAVEPKTLRGSFHSTRTYKKALRALTIERKPSTKTAVVVHLYYVETWPLIKSKLILLGAYNFDLFVTLPSHNAVFGDTIRNEFKHAYIIESPNQGRDVLPFIVVARELQKAGYMNLLKLHSKKSTHRTDGGEWFETILEELIPNSPETLNKLFTVLKDENTGVIGPSGQYVSLMVNFEANGLHMTRTINKLFSKKVSYEVLQKDRSEYGFFAGTMFWARLDTLQPILEQGFGPRQFELETGQIDATFAHALERLFCIVPEINRRQMYEIDTHSLKQIDYNAGDVPDWSNIYIGPIS